MEKNSARRRKGSVRLGFTLAELMVVIAIIALLVGILLPVISKAREQAKITACSSNLRSIGQSLFMYANANKDHLPNGNPPETWWSYDGSNQVMVDFNKNYVKSPAVFHCPADRAPMPTSIVTADQMRINSARISYEFFFLYWAPEYGPFLTKMKAEAPLGWDQDGGESTGILRNHVGGGNVLVSDGHVQWQPKKDWEMGSWPAPASTFYPSFDP